MFFCIGENQNSTCSLGQGKTLAEAIKNWAYTGQWHEIVEEFNTYDPIVVEGTELTIDFDVPEPKITVRT